VSVPHSSFCFIDALSLELKSEKQNAHTDYIRSVGFNHNGTLIVSGSDDKTIKVWGEWPESDIFRFGVYASFILLLHRCIVPGAEE